MRKESMNKYEKIEPIARAEAEAIIRRDKTEDIPLTLVRLAYHEPDWRWVQDLCIGLSDHPDKSVRRVCAICFGHIARIHGKLERDKVSPVLRRLLSDAEVRGDAQDTIEELDIFLE
jgi:hypothetical protein